MQKSKSSNSTRKRRPSVIWGASWHFKNDSHCEKYCLALIKVTVQQCIYTVSGVLMVVQGTSLSVPLAYSCSIFLRNGSLPHNSLMDWHITENIFSLIVQSMHSIKWVRETPDSIHSSQQYSSYIIICSQKRPMKKVTLRISWIIMHNKDNM